ncbi:hypothetical protein [Burkholderia lata]|uniref:hypothetical protein n=1 Tax=Burkholderia lata (strain ATCC 17760 / DSM 23089 / LMG 22485 / NCIMB 9086 / R18194 / 383) TaxID=482957 RepID=UPI0015837E22|nr:hypothetical protein [Burkholderia lata]
MENDDQNLTAEATRLLGAPLSTFIDIPGGKQTDFPDGSQLGEGNDSDKCRVSEAGDISATAPEIRRARIEDCSLVLRHEIATVRETTSHTLPFVGGGVFSLLYQRDGHRMSIQGKFALVRTQPRGSIVVCGAAG